MRNREFVFTPKIEYKLVAERSEANQNSLTFPTWCIYTTKLEPILAKISEFDERLRAPPKAGLRLNKIFFYIFEFCARPFSFFN